MLDETNDPRAGSDAPVGSVSTTADGGETEPAVTSGAADVGVALSVPAAGELGEDGAADVVDDEAEAEGAEASGADGADVSEPEGEGDEATVPDTDGEVDEAGAADIEVMEETGADGPVVVMAAGGAVGDGSGVGLAYACGTRADTQTITTAATMHDGPNLKPARVVEAT